MRKIVTKLAILLSVSSAILIGCVNLKPDNRPIESPIGVIPSDFDWKTVTTIKCTVQVQPVTGISNTAYRTIKIFNSPLLSSSSLIASGSATPGSPYVVTLTLATALEKIYVQEILPNGSSTVQTINVTSSTLTIAFTKSPGATFGAPMMLGASPVPSVTIPTNYDVTLTSSSNGSLSGFNTGETSAYGNQYKAYYLPSGVTNTNITSLSGWNNHLIIYVAGTLKVSSLSIYRASIFILDGGVVEVPSLSTSAPLVTNVPTIYIAPGGTLKLTSTTSSTSLSDGVYSINKGTITGYRHFTVSTGTDFYNEGTITLSSTKKTFHPTLYITNNSSLYNSGTIDTYGVDFTVSSNVTNTSGAVINVTDYSQTNSTTVNNYGEIAASETFGVSSTATLNNYCHITTDAATLGTTTCNMYEGSLFHCQSLAPNSLTLNLFGGSLFLVDGNISSVYNLWISNNTSTFSVLKCSGTISSGFTSTYGGGSSSVSGKVELVLTNLTEGSGTNGRLRFEPAFTNGAILTSAQTQNIPATTCNAGLGQLSGGGTPTDVDGDGIPAGTDIDDNDANVAFVSYFPAEGTWGTYAFEDLWPSMGDYDVNDLVMDFRIATYTNASNLVTKMKIDYNVRASGSTMVLGAAFQLDQVNASSVSSVTGQTLGSSGGYFTTSSNGTESDVSLAVIPLFNSQRELVSFSGFLNTDPTNSHYNTPDKSVVITFNSGLEQSKLSVGALNFFITAGLREKEIHLPTYSTTSKFSSSIINGSTLFSGDIYKYVDGMMWGLMIPQTFNHPIERSPINTVYLHFAEWATSGGTSYTDWYMPKSGYTNDALIYSY
ncbi:MAG: LruC domain-containing protein [Bacteroidales bacterium]|nr:LruC domain-containing protein [Bacteroidales bacterium]